MSLTSADGHGITDGSVFGEAWREVRKRIKTKSTFGSLPHWESKAFIIKHGDFVLQEQFVMQLIIQFQKVWETVCVHAWLSCLLLFWGCLEVLLMVLS
jgi:phosphatidylinositol kinase/protein kinase (PI-3  family)